VPSKKSRCIHDVKMNAMLKSFRPYICVLSAGFAFPFLSIYKSWLPSGYVELAGLYLQWAVGVFLAILFYTAILVFFRFSKIHSIGPLFSVDRIANAISSAWCIFVAIFVWQVLQYCQADRFWNKDGIVCGLRAFVGAIVFLPIALCLFTGSGRIMKTIRSILAGLQITLAFGLSLYLLIYSIPFGEMIYTKNRFSGNVRHAILYVSDTTRDDAVGMELEGRSLTPQIGSFCKGIHEIYKHVFQCALDSSFPCLIFHRASSGRAWGP